uniref:Uncharacterized protein n=1 Tax=Anguilla anguilla TaxID=7936 RepID=A0A0E9PIJ4_ANGAN
MRFQSGVKEPQSEREASEQNLNSFFRLNRLWRSGSPL